MNVKTALYNALAAGIVILGFSAIANAFELDCGTYEVIGRYEKDHHAIVLYSGTESEMRLVLYGRGIETEFMDASDLFYRIKIKVPKKVGDNGGPVRFLKVIELAHYDPKELQFKLIQKELCK